MKDHVDDAAMGTVLPDQGEAPPARQRDPWEVQLGALLEELASLGSVAPAIVDVTRRLTHHMVDRQRELNAKCAELSEQTSSLGKDRGPDIDALAHQLDEAMAQVERLQRVNFLSERIGTDALVRFAEAPDLVAPFQSEEAQDAFVVAIDIRRSTELMLKARSPGDFASFITTVAEVLQDTIRDNGGVVEKFTGDGILCCFPKFFSGTDAGYRALRAAEDCHHAFQDLYARHRDGFSLAHVDVGLGIGIDYGPCYFRTIVGSLTIVGPAVVYACRFSGGPPCTTTLNGPARKELAGLLESVLSLQQVKRDLKHEGWVFAYEAKLNSRIEPAPMPWVAPGSPPRSP